MSDSIFYYAHGKMLNDRYEDIITRKPQPTKTAQEIVDETMIKCGLMLKE